MSYPMLFTNEYYLANFIAALLFSVLLGISAFLRYLFIFTIIYLFPRIKLSIALDYRQLLKLALTLSISQVLVFQIFRNPSPHFLPISITASDMVQNAISLFTFMMITAWYAKFIFGLNKKLYYFFVLGSVTLGMFFNYTTQIGYEYFTFIVFAILISIVFYKYASTKKFGLLISILLCFSMIGITELISHYQIEKQQYLISKESQKFNEEIFNKTANQWKVFENKSGNYQIDYPSQLFYERNDSIGKNSIKHTQFHLLESSLIDYSSITFYVRPNPYLENWEKNHKGKLYNSRSGQKEIAIDHKVIDLGGYKADEYTYEKDGEINVETLFYVNNIPFTASTKYQKNLTAWPYIYRKMWTSIKPIQN